MLTIFILFILLILILCFIISETLQNCNSFSKTILGGNVLTNKHGKIDIFPKDIELTYTISGEAGGLDFSQFRQVLKESIKYNVHFVEKSITEKVNISFGSWTKFAVNGKLTLTKYDPLFPKQHASIKNVLGDHNQLINKSELYDTINKLIPNGIKYLPKSYTPNSFLEKNSQNVSPISQLRKHSNDLLKSVFILKKDYMVQQFGVKIITSQDEYYKAKKELNIKNDAIISEYIANPLLLDGKKMHLRVYYLLSIVSGITRCITHDEYRIHLAENEYKKDDWLNPDIHISGALGRSKNRRYYWPDDIASVYDIDLINEKMAKFNKVICMAFAISNAKNYPESYAGFHLYGADVLITDDFNIYLIEINVRPGFKFAQREDGWEDASRKFSHRLFSFILNSTIFPFFGIAPPPIYEAEFIGNGTLTAFGNILAGDNKCYLIPYNYAQTVESTMKFIKMAKNISFFKDSLLFENMIQGVNSNNIFLIGYLTNLTTIIIGYVLLTEQNFVKIAISKEYQKRGIATAIIAQLIEIYYARYFTNHNNYTMYINTTKHEFMHNIAKKLQFHDTKKYICEKKCQNHINPTLNKIINHKILTYKIINVNIVSSIISNNISQYMTPSNSQFVYDIIEHDPLQILKFSTGSKYNSEFIYQGSELKSALDIKPLHSKYSFKKWY